MDKPGRGREPRPMGESRRPAFYEFFAGAGMVRAGLGDGWDCLFANDIDPMKAAAYRDNWGAADFRQGDIAALTAADLPGHADLMWGSFPCQDLSLAGKGAGLNGGRSGTFHAFFDLVRALADEGRAPAVVAVENVCGTLTSRGGRDFETICRTFVEAGYRPGPLVIDAGRFLPQSRPRLFVIGLRADRPLNDLTAPAPRTDIQPPALVRAVQSLPSDLHDPCLWWRLPPLPATTPALDSIVEPDGSGLRWHAPAQTARLLSLMTPLHRARVEAARASGRLVHGAVYRRTRTEHGGKVQRAEIRFDRAGCLRTPAGGSSRQILMEISGDRVRSRLLTGRETARLMGLADSFRLPASQGAAHRITGDGVAAPVVAWLSQALFHPLLAGGARPARAA